MEKKEINYRYGNPKQLGISIDDYVKGVLSIIDSQNKVEPMLIKPSIESLKEKYNNSLCVMDGDEIIANSTIEPTIYDSLKDFKVAVMGTLIVKNKQKYRGNGIGGFLLDESQSLGEKNYDVIISTTFNEKVMKKRESFGYKKLNNSDINIPFEYLKSAKNAFMKMGEEHKEKKEKTKFNDALTFYKDLLILLWIKEDISEEKLNKLMKSLYIENLKYKEEILKFKNIQNDTREI